MRKYDRVNPDRQHDMAATLCGGSNSKKPKIDNNTVNEFPVQQAHASATSTVTSVETQQAIVQRPLPDLNAHMRGMFSGTTISGGIFNININIPSTSTKNFLEE